MRLFQKSRVWVSSCSAAGSSRQVSYIWSPGSVSPAAARSGGARHCDRGQATESHWGRHRVVEGPQGRHRKPEDGLNGVLGYPP